MRGLSGVLLVLLASGTWAQAPRPGGLHSTPTHERMVIDGEAREEAWRHAEPFEDFHQTYPTAGPPPQRTEAWVLHDEHNLYFFIRCHDTRPGEIIRTLGLRDRFPAGDDVSVMLATRGDDRTAFVFTLSAAGGLKDGLITEDTQTTLDWDGNWEGATRLDPGGWSAELRIPLRLLRFERSAEQRWRINLRRELGRTHELMDSSVIAWKENVLVSRFGELSGLGALEPENPVELAPYAAARAQWRPRFLDPARPLPRLLLPSMDLGLDVHAALPHGLSLNATLNPDFGDVEADQLVLNLTNIETFFPEKRPFFIRGMDLFQPVGAQRGQTSQMLFYSRRIGLDAPVLGALKLTGPLTPGLEIGVLDAVVAGAEDPTQQAALRVGLPGDGIPPDPRVQFHPGRPLHLGLNAELPAEAPVTRNFLVAVAHGQLAPGTHLGGTLAASTPLEARCTPGAGVAVCTPLGSAAGALDFSTYSRDGAWGVLGQVEGSRLTHGPAEGVLLQDGTRLRPGDTGVGGYVRAGRVGGEPWRAWVDYEFTSPRLELNGTGYLESQNQQVGRAQVMLVHPFWRLQEFTLSLSGKSAWSTDGRAIRRDNGVYFKLDAVTPGYHYFSSSLEHWFGRNDLREISGTGIPFERPSLEYADVVAETDPSRLLVLTGYAYGILQQSVRRQYAWGVNVTLGYKPHPRWELKLTGTLTRPRDSPFFMQPLGAEDYLFAELNARVLSLTLRQSLALTPRLTLSVYAQLFSGRGLYGPFYSGHSEGGAPIHLADLREVDSAVDPHFLTSGLRINAVLRWEYRLGSILYVAYARTQDNGPRLSDSPSLLPGELWQGPATDLLMVKLSYAVDL